MAERWQRELRKIECLDPPVGLWDRVLQRSAARHEPGARQEPASQQPGHPGAGAHRDRNAVAAALAVAVLIGAVGLVRALGQPAGQSGSMTRQAGRYVDPQFGWTIRYPKGVEVGHFQNLFSEGIRITSFPPDLRARSTVAFGMGWLRSFPADGVAMQVWYDERGPWAPPLRDSSFPLAPVSLRRIPPYVGGQEPAPRSLGFYADGFPFAIAVWLGPQSSRAQQRAIWTSVRSLRFPKLRGGTIWQHMFYVLGPASRYPLGSVTTFPAQSLPSGQFPDAGGFYLIHAPRAFYVISRFQYSQNPRISCPVALDRRAFQFFCPGTGLRWNRNGQPLGKHAGNRDWALLLRIATVSLDGHVLFSPDFGGLLPVLLRGANPWG